MYESINVDWMNCRQQCIWSHHMTIPCVVDGSDCSACIDSFNADVVFTPLLRSAEFTDAGTFILSGVDISYIKWI